MSSFKQLQSKRLLTSTPVAPTSSFLRPTRPLTPAPEPAPPVTQAELERAARLGHSFARIPLFPPASDDAHTRGEPLQGRFESAQNKENKTGLPDTLKAGVESLSSLSMDDVNVHYNSSKPAYVQALAYTQGTNIHVGPGQEKHLAHEAWHVAQQKQGRVKPTLQAKGVAINDDQRLEREADEMGERARIVGGTEVQRKKVNDLETVEENSSPTPFTPGQFFNVAKVVQEQADMKARKNQKNDLQSSLLMLQEARNQRGNDVATEDEITQHDRALRSGQHHSVRNVHLNQLIADIEGKKEELTNLNLRDSDLLGVERKAGRGDGGRALQLKDNG